MAKKKTDKPTENQTYERSAVTNLLFAITAIFASYILGLWAIDSGSLLVYAITAGALYAFVHYLKLFIRLAFFNNDKTAKAKSSKR